MKLDPAHRRELLALARASIESALPHGAFVDPPSAQHCADLMTPRSSFISLYIDGELRGCCGTLDAPQPLAHDVWRNAWTSAFRDPRFAPLQPDEWRRTDLHVSVLTRPEPLSAVSEQDLLAQLRPGVDGLILELGAARATFLPAVWAQLTEPARFVRHLKVKAGWAPDFWSPQIRASRYESESFGGAGGGNRENAF